MYSMHNEGKSVVAKRSIRTLKNKISKCITSVSKNVYIDKLDVIVNKYSNNNTYHKTIKMKPTDVISNSIKLELTLVNSSQELNDKDAKFKIGDIVRISEYKNVFAKGYVPHSSEEVFVITKLKILFCGHMVLVILK